MAEFTLSVPDNIIGAPPLGENQAEPSVIEPSVVEPDIVNDPVVETVTADPVVAEADIAESSIADPAIAKPIPVETVIGEPSFVTINVGHGSFQIDSNASQEAKNKALKNYIENDIDFYEGIDRESGASWSAQKAVGDSLRQDDKLAALRGFYPDAEPFGEENFIFTNSDTGKITLFNPPGFQVKDIARYGRPASIVVGSTLAGIAGGTSGLFS